MGFATESVSQQTQVNKTGNRHYLRKRPKRKRPVTHNSSSPKLEPKEKRLPRQNSKEDVSDGSKVEDLRKERTDAKSRGGAPERTTDRSILKDLNRSLSNRIGRQIRKKKT